jgi:hypothetical protein
VKIKEGKYGNAIGLLLENGGSFQTCHERTLIVNAQQRRLLEAADFIEPNGPGDGVELDRGKETNHI